MTEPAKLQIYRYLENLKPNGARWTKIWKQVTKKNGKLITEPGFKKALDDLIERGAVVWKIEGSGRIYYRSKEPNVKALFPEMYDRDMIQSAFENILFHSLFIETNVDGQKYRGLRIEDLDKPQMLDQVAMIKLRNNIGKIKFVSNEYKHLALKKNITDLDNNALKVLIEVVELFGYRFIIQKGEFLIERVDKLAWKKPLLKDKLLGN